MTSKFYFIPEDWQLSAKLLKWTKDRGLSDKQIAEQRELIGDHQYKRQMMRPDACWRNWIKNGIKWENITPTVQKEYSRPAELTAEQRAIDAEKAEADFRRLRAVK